MSTDDINQQKDKLPMFRIDDLEPVVESENPNRTTITRGDRKWTISLESEPSPETDLVGLLRRQGDVDDITVRYIETVYGKPERIVSDLTHDDPVFWRYAVREGNEQHNGGFVAVGYRTDLEGLFVPTKLITGKTVNTRDIEDIITNAHNTLYGKQSWMNRWSTAGVSGVIGTVAAACIQLVIHAYGRITGDYPPETIPFVNIDTNALVLAGYIGFPVVGGSVGYVLGKDVERERNQILKKEGVLYGHEAVREIEKKYEEFQRSLKSR